MTARRALLLGVGAGALALAAAVFLVLPRKGTAPIGSAPQSAGQHDARLPSRPYRIGVLYWSSTIQGQITMRKGLEAEADRLRREEHTAGIELIAHVAGDGTEGQSRQIEQMRQLIQGRVDAIIVQPTDNTALSAPLREANQAGIPVVAYDQYIEGGRLAAYITSDNRQAGVLDGEYIAHRYANDKTLKIVLVEYPQVSSTVERLDGFLATLRDQGQPYQIVATHQAVEPVGGRQAGEQILKAFPQKGSVDIVFTVNDGGGLSVVDVLAAAGRDEIVVATIDGDPRSVENIRSGRLTAIDAAQFCGPLGAAAMKSAFAILQGKSVPAHQLIPTFPITKETLSRYPGWAGPLPPPFDKPWPSKEPLWTPELREVKPR